MAKTILLILPLLFVLVGCNTSIQRPTASVTRMTMGEITASGLTMNFDVDVKNPNGFALPVANLDYGLDLGGKHLLDGKAKPEGSVPAGGSRNVSLPVAVTFENLLAVEEAIRQGNGDVPFALDAGMEFSSPTPLLGQSIRVPLKYSGTLPLRQLLRDPSVLLKSPAARKLAERALGGFFGR